MNADKLLLLQEELRDPAHELEKKVPSSLIAPRRPEDEPRN